MRSRTCRCGKIFIPSHPSIYQCPYCKREYDRAWRAKQPKLTRIEAKDRRLRRLYGISLEEYDCLRNKQDGKCAICGSKGTETKSGTRYALAVDHCHITGSVRGLLCQDCNSGLGSLKDDVALLERAILYLKEHHDYH